MKTTALILALASSAAAFAPANQDASSTRLHAAKLDEMAGFTAPFKGFDPLDLANLGSDETLAWFRAAELKHSRVAMLATTGYIVQASGYHFPGMLSKDVSFESLSSMKPFDAWDAVPEGGKWYLCGSINFDAQYLDNDGTSFCDFLLLSSHQNEKFYFYPLHVVSKHFFGIVSTRV